MSRELASSTVVITGRQFNPSIIRDRWLEKYGILDAEDFEAGCVYTDAFADVHSRDFDLLVVPAHLQFIPKIEEERQRDLIVEKVGRIVDCLPHTPFGAIGLNFTWHLFPEGQSIEQITKGMFFLPAHPLHQEFDSPDARFGGYFSKNILDRRLKLNIKPVKVVSDGEELPDAVQFAFNFHLDLNQEESLTEQIHDSLKRWDEVRNEAERLLNLVAGAK